MPPSVGDTSVKDAGLRPSGGISVNVGKVASALLAKHVRTLEVLHSLQRENAQLTQEIKKRCGEEEIRLKIDEAVAEAVVAPNELSEELQSEGKKLRGRIEGLEKELVSAKIASAKTLDQAGNEIQALRGLNETLEKKCKDLESEAIHQARHASLQGELEAQVRNVSAALTLAENRASDLARSVADREKTLRALQLSLKEKDTEIRVLKTAHTVLVGQTNEDKVRIAEADRRGRCLRDKLAAAEDEATGLRQRLKRISADIEALREENVDRTSKEEDLLEKVAEYKLQVNAADTKLAEERNRLLMLNEDAKRREEEGTRRYKDAQAEYGYERERLVERIDILSREIESLRAQMRCNRSQFSKYVEAKTENTHLKEELDGLREMVAVPRPPHRSHSFGSGPSAANSILGGVINKHVGVERLRHSISVARGHQSSNSNNNGGNSSCASSYSTGSGNNSRTGSQVSTPSIFQQGDISQQGKLINSGGGKRVLVRRHSVHNTSGSGTISSGSGSGWTGANQATSYKLSVTSAGSSVVGAVDSSIRGSESSARQRGLGPAQQVF